MGDRVTVAETAGTWTVVGTRDSEPSFEVQLGRDAGSKRFVRTSDLMLVQKAAKSEPEPGFYPTRSIMG
jgi:hypothetical protein